MARFYIGQPVVYVDDRLRAVVVRRYPGIKWPRRGACYVIRGIIENGKMTFVTVQEIRNSIVRYPDGTRAEAGFHEDRFEPAPNIDDLKKVAANAPRFTGTDGNPEWDRRVKRRKKENA